MTSGATKPFLAGRRTSGRPRTLAVLGVAFVMPLLLISTACSGPAGSGAAAGALGVALPGTGGAPPATVEAHPDAAPASPSSPLRRAEPEEGADGLDTLGLVPSLLESLGPAGCDFDDPLSRCQ